MPFRALFHLPSFGSYLNGFSFKKTLAYAVADDLDRELHGPARRAEYWRKKAEAVQIRYNLMLHGILPWPGSKKATPKAVSTYQPGQPREVIEPRSVCAPAWQPYPAARKENGGLRGSKATRWKR